MSPSNVGCCPLIIVSTPGPAHQTVTHLRSYLFSFKFKQNNGQLKTWRMNGNWRLKKDLGKTKSDSEKYVEEELKFNQSFGQALTNEYDQNNPLSNFWSSEPEAGRLWVSTILANMMVPKRVLTPKYSKRFQDGAILQQEYRRIQWGKT